MKPRRCRAANGTDHACFPVIIAASKICFIAFLVNVTLAHRASPQRMVKLATAFSAPPTTCHRSISIKRILLSSRKTFKARSYQCETNRRGLLNHSYRASSKNEDDIDPSETKTTVSPEITNALDALFEGWQLKKSSKVQRALESSPELTFAVSDPALLQNFSLKVGRIPKHRLQRMVIQHPQLLAQALQSNCIQSIQHLFGTELGWTDSQWEKASRRPDSHRWSRSNLRRLLLLFRSETHLTDSQISKILISRPQLLCRHADTLLHTVHFFRHELGLSVDSVTCMLRTYPLILTYSVDKKLRPTVTFLQQELGNKGWTGWQRIITRYPQCLTHSVKNVLRPNVTFLNDILCLQRSSDVAHIVCLFPPTMWLSQALVREKVLFLTEALGLNEHELRDLIVTFPQVLGLSVNNNLEMKIAFFLQEADMTPDQLKDFVLYQPALLAYSLEGRIRPRIKQLQGYSISFGYTPPYLMSLPESKFQRWLDMHTSDWSVLS